MKIVYVVAITIFFCSCDPMDDRLIIRNNTSEQLFVRLCFVKNEKLHDTWAGIRPIARNEENVIAIMGNWKSEFNRSNIENLHVIIHGNFNLLAVEESKLKNISDSLIRAGDYRYKTYMYKDLELRGWKISYPDDGFNNGIPIGEN